MFGQVGTGRKVFGGHLFLRTSFVTEEYTNMA
jgi:hypothetical protein